MILGSFFLNTLNATVFSPMKLKSLNEMHEMERTVDVGGLGFENLDENLKLALDPVSKFFVRMGLTTMSRFI